MAEIQTIISDLRGQTYEQVDATIHSWAGIPADKEFYKLNRLPFRGTVPKKMEPALYNAILYSQQKDADLLPSIVSTYKHFRFEYFFANMFMRDKPVHGHRYRNIVVFDTSAYEAITQESNVNFFKELAKVFQYDNNAIEIHSILKDKSVEKDSRDTCTPFVRNHIALLIIRLNKNV